MLCPHNSAPISEWWVGTCFKMTEFCIDLWPLSGPHRKPNHIPSWDGELRSEPLSGPRANSQRRAELRQVARGIWGPKPFWSQAFSLLALCIPTKAAHPLHELAKPSLSSLRPPRPSEAPSNSQEQMTRGEERKQMLDRVSHLQALGAKSRLFQLKA